MRPGRGRLEERENVKRNEKENVKVNAERKCERERGMKIESESILIAVLITNEGKQQA
jgi:hypothetical protein